MLKQCGHPFSKSWRLCSSFREYIPSAEWEEDLSFPSLLFPAGKGECREFSPRMDLGQRWPLRL